jgi:predicted CxxxxCH...CXXCH cytochrome family protein
MNGLDDTSAVGCATCHGDATRVANLTGTDVNLASAPPVAPAGSPSYAVGAHLGHVNPTTTSYLMAPVTCAECHVVPVDSAHATNPPAAVVVFGTLSKTGGAAPSFAAGTAGCAATYCHGKFTFNAVLGSSATPVWTTAAAMTCTSCHGMPPTGHPAITGTPNAVSCFQCHPQSVNADGTIKQAGGHINGKADGGGCTGCHADPPTTGKHTNSNHKNRRCDACHPTGYTSSTTVAAFHNDGKADLGTQAGYKCNNVASLVGCPTGQKRTCANSCHGSESW